jgi:hypothetical protein
MLVHAYLHTIAEISNRECVRNTAYFISLVGQQRLALER